MTEVLNWVLRWIALLALGFFLAWLVLQVFALFLEEMGVWKEKPKEKDKMSEEDRRRKEQEDQRRKEQMSEEDRKKELWVQEERKRQEEERRREDLKRRILTPGVWIEANWGGLGGGLSGWRVSNAITYFLLMSFLLGCLTLAVFSLAPASEKKDVKKQEAQSEQKSDAVKKGDQKKEADKKDDQNAAKQGEPTQSDRKPDKAKTPGDEDLKKSSNAPAANK